MLSDAKTLPSSALPGTSSNTFFYFCRFNFNFPAMRLYVIMKIINNNRYLLPADGNGYIKTCREVEIQSEKFGIYDTDGTY